MPHAVTLSRTGFGGSAPRDSSPRRLETLPDVSEGSCEYAALFGQGTCAWAGAPVMAALRARPGPVPVVTSSLTRASPAPYLPRGSARRRGASAVRPRAEESRLEQRNERPRHDRLRQEPGCLPAPGRPARRLRRGGALHPLQGLARLLSGTLGGVLPAGGGPRARRRGPDRVRLGRR